jgi:hypothetical protein
LTGPAEVFKLLWEEAKLFFPGVFVFVAPFTYPPTLLMDWSVTVAVDCFLVLLLEKGDFELNEEMREEEDFFLAGVLKVDGSGRFDTLTLTRCSAGPGGEGGLGRWWSMMAEL